MCFMVRSMFYLGWIFVKCLCLEFSFLHVGVQLFQHHLLNRLYLFCSAIFPLSKSSWLCLGASLVAQMAKNPCAMQDTWVQSLDWEDPMEKGLATHSVFLLGVMPWTEVPGGLQSMGSQRVRHNWATKHSTAQETLFLDSLLCSIDLFVLFFHQYHTVLITVSLLSIIFQT